MEYEQIKYEVSERILTITLNRPDNLNAYTLKMGDEIMAALDQAEADDNIRAIIVTGEGRAFCAGMDLGDRGDTFNYSEVPQDEHRDGGGVLALRIYKLTKPIIAAINGPAVGIGLTMTFPMDIRIAVDTAKMGVVFVRRGVVVDACSSWFLPKIVGMGKALEWALSGKVFTAREALAAGLLNQMVAPDELIPAARAIALEIARNTAPVSVALARQLIWSMAGQEHPMEAHRIESKCFHWLGQQADAAEGIAAFLEKRSPNYTMSPHKNLPDFFPWAPEPDFKTK